jgi:hypothetical protein
MEASVAPAAFGPVLEYVKELPNVELKRARHLKSHFDFLTLSIDESRVT